MVAEVKKNTKMISRCKIEIVNHSNLIIVIPIPENSAFTSL